jgi:ABC-type glycerol-3-phosphate transport system permease component
MAGPGEIELKEISIERTIITRLDLRKPSIKLLYGFLYFAVFLIGLIEFIPLYWMFVGSLKGAEEVFQIPPSFLPHQPQWANYKALWEQFDFIKFTLNSVILCALVLLPQLTLVPLAAYALAKLRPPYANVLLIVFLSTMMIPPELRMVPSYLIMKAFPFEYLPFTQMKLPHINFVNTYWPFILPFATGRNLFLYKSFFEDIPDDLIDAARIDGWSELKIFVSLVYPLSKPVLAVISIFSFMGRWTTYMGPLIYLETEAKYPLALAVAYRVRELSLPWNSLMALSILTTIPMFIFFLFAQKYILRGISLSGLKW